MRREGSHDLIPVILGVYPVILIDYKFINLICPDACEWETLSHYLGEGGR